MKRKFDIDPGFHDREHHEGPWIMCMKCLDHDLASNTKEKEGQP